MDIFSKQMPTVQLNFDVNQNSVDGVFKICCEDFITQLSRSQLLHVTTNELITVFIAKFES